VKTLLRFLRLRPAERRLLLEALLLLWMSRFGLWVLSLETLQRSVARLARPRVALQERGSCPVERIIWAVRAVSRYVPKATCLSEALAARILLGRRGHASRLHIGVARDEAKEFRAHAWLECQGAIVMGGSEAARYAPLVVLGDAG